MKCALALLLAVVSVVAARHLEQPAESQDIIDYVNNAHTTWKAARNFHEGFKKSDVRRLLGHKQDELSTLPVKQSGRSLKTIPDTFDSRTEWPSCTSIQNIKDQSDCGSCWAVSAAATFSDRLCIVSDGEFNDELAATELLSCCWYCGSGCDGGFLGMSWLYFRVHGIVTGGSYGSGDGCQPYPLEPCEHHGSSSVLTNCSSFDFSTPKCHRTCTNSDYSIAFKSDNHKVKKAYSIKKSVTAIQEEIMTNGPVQAAFSVYSDFLSYSSGVYQQTTGSYEGGHAVKIIGWGTEDGTDYWLVANSWNTDWGEDGFFKILRGSNECGIEGSIHAGIPEWSS